MDAHTQDQLIISVDLNGREEWELDLVGTRVTCHSLQSARELALLNAERRRPCEVVIRDAYHRVLDRRVFEEAR